MPIENLRELSPRFAIAGRIEAIVLRPQRQKPAIFVTEVEAQPGYGLIGDRRAQKEQLLESARKREITLIQAEHIPLIAQWCSHESLSPLQLRRNLVISGLNLLAMRSPFPNLKLHWQIGEQVELEITGTCDPCSRMEEDLGFGAYNAMRGHGGMTGRLLVGGIIHVGDRVQLKEVHQIQVKSEG
jgi:MOSC domain-containing protein YiiM